MKMHSTAFVSFLFALPCSAMATAKYCLTGIEIEVGEKCFLEGYEYCGPNCTDIMTCTNGTYELTTTCADKKTCFWEKATGKAECVEDEDDETTILGVHGIALEPNSGCSPNFKIGALCGTDPEIEGEMRCDDTCTNVGICHNGVFQVNSPCYPGRCQWNPDSGLPFCL